MMPGLSPAVTVVVPARNEEAIVADTLADIRAQTFGDYELVVVDNGSDDRTPEIAHVYADRVVSEPARGYMHAAHRGLCEARGALVAFCDADTRYPEDWLSRITGAFEREPELVAVYGPFTVHDSLAPLNRFTGDLILGLQHATRLLGREFSCSCNLAVRPEAYRAAGGYRFDERVPGCDLRLGHRLSRVGAIGFLPDLRVSTSIRTVRRMGKLRWAKMIAEELWAMMRHEVPP